MTKKAVFISSTFKDLHEHRRAVWEALKPFDVSIRGMEAFGARTSHGGRNVAVTRMEFDLLVALLRRQGAVTSRIDLLKEVSGHSSAVLTRTVDTHIGELRRKLEADPLRRATS